MSINSSALLSTTSSTSSSTSSSSTTGSTSLDFESFLELLAAELKYQDPTDPVSATEYVTQMTQISSLSQLSSIYSTVNNVTAYSMIGKEAAYTTTDSSGNSYSGSGIVQSVTVSGSNTYVNVGGTTVLLSSITQVSSADSTATA